jgi:hypothetical protein
MLIFSVSFQFYRMSPKRRSGGRRWTYKPVYVMVAGRSGTNYRFVPWSLPPQAVATTRTPAWAGCLGAAQISFVPFPSWSWTSQAHARVFALTHIHWKFAGPDNVDCCCLHCTCCRSNPLHEWRRISCSCYQVHLRTESDETQVDIQGARSHPPAAQVHV